MTLADYQSQLSRMWAELAHYERRLVLDRGNGRLIATVLALREIVSGLRRICEVYGVGE